MGYSKSDFLLDCFESSLAEEKSAMDAWIAAVAKQDDRGERIAKQRLDNARHAVEQFTGR